VSSSAPKKYSPVSLSSGLALNVKLVGIVIATAGAVAVVIVYIGDDGAVRLGDADQPTPRVIFEVEPRSMHQVAVFVVTVLIRQIPLPDRSAGWDGRDRRRRRWRRTRPSCFGACRGGRRSMTRNSWPGTWWPQAGTKPLGPLADDLTSPL
jgi:hypothetical protein